MKRILFCIISLSVMLCSCHKDRNANVGPANKATYNVKFNVGFTESTAPFITNNLKLRLASTGTDTLASHINIVYYMLYDSTGTAIRRITQTSSDTSFGTISDKIAAGTYTVAIIAGDGTLAEVNLETDGTILPMHDYFGYVTTGTTNFAPWKDTFLKKFNITVNGTTSNYNVSLDRIVAQLQVNVQDSIPSGAANLSVKVKQDFSNFYIQGNVPTSPVSPTFKLTNLVPGATNTLITADVINTTTPFSVEITCTNAAGTVTYADKTVTNVTCVQNQVTLLTGTLFGGTVTGNSFKVTYNPAWNTTPLNIGF
jgi:hypothetical protein